MFERHQVALQIAKQTNAIAHSSIKTKNSLLCTFGLSTSTSFQGYSVYRNTHLPTPQAIQLSDIYDMDMNTQLSIAKGMRENSRDLQDINESLQSWQVGMKKDEARRKEQNRQIDQLSNPNSIEVSCT